MDPQEKFRQQAAMLKKLMHQFSEFPKKIDELTQQAAHDPQAKACLERLEQAWNNGLSEDIKKMEVSAKKTLAQAQIYQRMLLQPSTVHNGVDKSSEPAVVPVQPTHVAPLKMPPKKKKRMGMLA